MATTPQPSKALHTSSGEDETSPFSMLKGRYEYNSGDYNDENDQQQQQGGAAAGFILRTRSLDEANDRHHGAHQQGGGEHEHADREEAASSASAAVGAAVALHSSFDVGMLRDRDRSGSPLFFSEQDQEHDEDDGEDYSYEYGELSGKKHLRPRATVLEDTLEANPPGTVRKQPRRTTVTAMGAAISSKTPARPRLRPPGAMKKSASSTTPSSAAKRRRAHWQVGDSSPVSSSPSSRVPPTTPFHPQAHPPITSPPTTNSCVKLDGSIFARHQGAPLTSGSSSSTFFAPSSPPAFTPNHQTPGPFGGGGTGTNQKSMSKWHNTGTTAASSTRTALLETTIESSPSFLAADDHHSVDTSSPTTTRFRFTSFPASLPRVNNHPRNSPSSCHPDSSLRKRIPFGAVATEPEEQDHHHLNNNNNNAANNTSCTNQSMSRDDDAGTQNTSISSLSAEGGGGGHHQHLAAAPGALPPTILDLQQQQIEQEQQENDSMRPIHAKLFAEDEVFGYSDDDDDDTESSAVGDMVGRTRLNFNNALSPLDKDGPSKTKGADFNNMDLTNTYDQRRINSFPSSLSSHTHMNNLSGCENVGGGFTPARGGGTSSSNHRQDQHQPLTPREVALHFHLDEDYSPIQGFKDDSGRCEMHDPLPSHSEHSLFGQGLLPRRRSNNQMDSVMMTTMMKEESSSTGSGSANGKSRRLRPMPDMSAFESSNTHGGTMSSSRGDRSSDDSATLDSKPSSSSQQRLTCPPTPVRTPAWANEGGALARFGRQSSLITTKVLLSVPSQVVEGRCSLENSVLDDDSKAGVGSQKEDGLATSNKLNIATLLAPSLTAGGAGQGEEPPGPAAVAKIPKLHAPPRLTRRVPPGQEVDSVISFSNDFEILCVLGSGAFADVYKVRSVKDNRLYAVKRNRRQFRGKRDRDMALAEVQAMQRLESVYAETSGTSSQSAEKSSYCLYLLFFYRAWQEDGYFFCQTELCCRDTCRELLDSLRLVWNTAKNRYPSLRRHLESPGMAPTGNEDDAAVRPVPNDTVWKICHDIAAGLSHIHSHGMVHHDIKPSNIFFVAHPRFGAMCKIGDFGMAGESGSSADGLEGDTRYMPPELLALGKRHPSGDIFSLGLTIYEIASDEMTEMPSEGPQWHFLRSSNGPTLPKERGVELLQLVQAMTDPNELKRPTADTILKSRKVVDVGHGCDHFLRDYIHDIEAFDQMEEERLAMDCHEDQTPRNGSHRSVMPARSPSLSMLMSNPPNLLSPVAKCIH